MIFSFPHLEFSFYLILFDFILKFKYYENEICNSSMNETVRCEVNSVRINILPLQRRMFHSLRILSNNECNAT